MALRLDRIAVACSLAMLVLAAGAVEAEAPGAWSGTYAYTEDGGRNAGGSPIIITHEIAVTRDGGRERARYCAVITANGYQTARHLFATGEVSGAKLMLRFEREGEDQMFKGQYQPGVLLLELERRAGRGVLTHWRAYTPAARERYANPGVYFRRQ